MATWSDDAAMGRSPEIMVDTSVTRALLRCPIDGGVLEWQSNDQGAHCRQCGAQLGQQHGVYTTGTARNDFYEGRYVAHVKYVPRGERLVHAWPIWLISSGYLWAVRRVLAAGSTVAELGCGGGIAYFGARYSMVGLDLSLTSLQKAATSYSAVMQCDVTGRLPLADESLDGIVSASFLEHITPEVKGHLLAECHRALKPGGKLVFVYDVETRNPLIVAMMRSDPERYRALFLENDGHIGYEPFDRNLRHFREAGFHIEEHLGLEKTPFLAMSAITKFAQWPTLLGRLFRMAQCLNFRPMSFAYMTFLRLLDVAVGPLLPDRWSRVALVVCRKP